MTDLTTPILRFDSIRDRVPELRKHWERRLKLYARLCFPGIDTQKIKLVMSYYPSVYRLQYVVELEYPRRAESHTEEVQIRCYVFPPRHSGSLGLLTLVCLHTMIGLCAMIS